MGVDARRLEATGDREFPAPRGLHAAAAEGAALMETILIIVLIIALIGVLPTWPHSRSWGYYPSGGIGLILLIVIIVLLIGRT